MTDREKIVEILRRHGDNVFGDKTYDGIQFSLYDVVDLLKEKEAKPMLEVDEDDDLYAWSPRDVSYYCPRPECQKKISYDYNFCPYCGQAVKLDD